MTSLVVMSSCLILASARETWVESLGVGQIYIILFKPLTRKLIVTDDRPLVRFPPVCFGLLAHCLCVPLGNYPSEVDHRGFCPCPWSGGDLFLFACRYGPWNSEHHYY